MLLPIIATDLRTAANLQGRNTLQLTQWTNLQTAMSNYYLAPGAGASEINWSITWEWNTNNVKRGEINDSFEKRQACTQPADTLTATSDVATQLISTGSTSPSTSAPTAIHTASSSALHPSSVAADISATIAADISVVESAAAYPTASASCFPYHDVNDLQIANPWIPGYCAGNDTGWFEEGGDDPSSAAGSNLIHSGYTLVDNAPPECHDLYQNGHSDYVTMLCSEPLMRILKDCPYNGGSVSNVCGQWWLQTCPYSITCQPGCPGGSYAVGDPRCGKPWPPPSKM